MSQPHNEATCFEQFIQDVEKVKRNESSLEEVLSMLNSEIIGSSTNFTSPFGTRKIFYADYFASGKSLSMVEDHIKRVVLP